MPSALTAGDTVLGRYRLDGLIARGGASDVHRAKDLRTGEDVAVKAIPSDTEMAKRVGGEIRANMRLSHPAIVHLRDFGEDDATCYLVSDLVSGVSLREFRGANPPTAEIVAVVADVLEGLEHAHAHGVTHRDVKPANILVDASRKGRLTDFGIARIAGEAGVTTVGGLVGTVSYMAPEQARGEATGPATDVYSACLVLYEALAGVNPNVGATSGETLRNAAEGRIPSLVGRVPGLPHALCTAIDAGLDPIPARRPDAAWLARTLRAQLPAIATPTPHRPTLHPRWGQLAGAAAGAGLTVALLLRWSELPPAGVAVAATVAGLGAAVVPWITALAGWMIAMVAVARIAPATGILVGAAGLAALAPLRHRGRLALLAASAPVLMILGIIPLYALAAGLLRQLRWRIWAIVTGLGAALTWNAIVGAAPSIDGGRTTGTWDQLVDVVSPIRAVEIMAEPFRTRPSLLVAAGLLAVAALLITPLTRLPFGIPRVVGVVVWFAALIAAVGMTGGSIENAVGAFLAGGILIALWAAFGGRRPARRADRQKTVTIGGSTVERLPAA